MENEFFFASSFWCIDENKKKEKFEMRARCFLPMKAD